MTNEAGLHRPASFFSQTVFGYGSSLRHAQ